MAKSVTCCIVALLALVSLPSAVEAACAGAGTTWTCPAGSTVADVQHAIDAAADEATITFATGDYDWTAGRISLNGIDGVSLVCEALGACRVQHDGDLIYKDEVPESSNKLHRISGFVFTGTAGTGTIWFLGTHDLTAIRVDHNTFNDTGSGCTVAVFFGATDAGVVGNMYGVVDHNRFSAKNRNTTGVKNLAGQDAAWKSGLPGSSNNLFIEDNTFDYPAAGYDPGCGCIDAWSGGPTVFRYNSTNNCRAVVHGVCHGGPPNFEVYRNTIRTPDGVRHIHHQGSGEMFVFDNDVTNGGDIALLHYRSCPSADTGCNLPRCDGSQNGDGNRTPIGSYYGYPCRRQPGRDANGTLRPIFAWNNHGDRGKVDIEFGNAWGCSAPAPEDHVKPNRDFYNAVSASAQSSTTTPFDGTTGMGFGTMANRPDTCTTTSEVLDAGNGGVGYWATDVGSWNRTGGSQGSLFMCTGKDSWTPYYTPYRYPHPLVAPEACDAVTMCSNGDGCCPTSCTVGNDGDCGTGAGSDGSGCGCRSSNPEAALLSLAVLGMLTLGVGHRRKRRALPARD